MKQERYDESKHGPWTGDAYYLTKDKIGPKGEPYKDIVRDTVDYTFERIRHGANKGYFCTLIED